VFQERLYGIRWVETYTDQEGKVRTRRHCRAPTQADLAREAKVLALLQERFADWQEKGYIPSRRIEPGAKTDEPIRTRGWTHWHHLFTPRQLITTGLFSQLVVESKQPIAALLLLGRVANNNSRLSRWKPSQSGGIGGVIDVFSNQALNTFANFGGRPMLTHDTLLLSPPVFDTSTRDRAVTVCDARAVAERGELWITDPPYADAVNYEEISEFFLAWYEQHLPRLFPDWYTDSKRALAVKGSDESFRQAMVECYRRLRELMPDNGLQIVMFTHQDAAVWADLTMILWAAGLRVTAAWCIATETDSALKQGNYVQGTVLLVLRKRTEAEAVFLDEITHKVEAEVTRQLDAMTALDDHSDPNFGDADYQLAAYAAALRVLTERPIEEINPAREIARERSRGEVGPVEELIRKAVKTACDYLVPRGLEGELWKTLSAMERFYLKGLEVESHGEYRNGVYQELARGFGATDYSSLLATTRANETRLKSATDFGRRMLSEEGFAGSLVRQALFAICQTVAQEETREGMNWLRTEVSDYWANRERLVGILEYLASLGRAAPMGHWAADAHAASLLAGAVHNDHV
jgi:adenine-specific DNA methylase